MKGTKKRFFALILVLCLSLGGCGIASGGAADIKTLISDFELSCQQLDLYGILDCINPDVAGPVRLVLQIFMWITKTDANGVVEDIAGYVFNNEYDIKDIFDDLSFDDPEIKIIANEATAECNLVYIIGSTGINDMVDELKEQLDTLPESKDVSSVKAILAAAETKSGYEHYEVLQKLEDYEGSDALAGTNISDILSRIYKLDTIQTPVTILLNSSKGNWYISGIRLGN